MVGTRVLQGVRAVDADQPGPFSTVQYAVLPGPHSVPFRSLDPLSETDLPFFSFFFFRITSCS